VPNSLDPAVVRAMEELLARENAEKALVRAEISHRGLHWAAKEIWDLRRQLAARQKKRESIVVD
jgi:hypothetical protein